jgi:hypothetical protein
MKERKGGKEIIWGICEIMNIKPRLFHRIPLINLAANAATEGKKAGNV